MGSQCGLPIVAQFSEFDTDTCAPSGTFVCVSDIGVGFDEAGDAACGNDVYADGDLAVIANFHARDGIGDTAPPSPATGMSWHPFALAYVLDFPSPTQGSIGRHR